MPCLEEHAMLPDNLLSALLSCARLDATTSKAGAVEALRAQLKQDPLHLVSTLMTDPGCPPGFKRLAEAAKHVDPTQVLRPCLEPTVWSCGAGLIVLRVTKVFYENGSGSSQLHEGGALSESFESLSSL